MSNENIDFLKANLSQLESRISLVDNKASILVAIQVGFLGLFGLLMKTVFLDNPQLDTPVALVVFVFSTSIVVIILLLQTIQPARMVFWYKVDLFKKKLPDDYLMWFTEKKTKEEYFANVDKLNDSKILENLKLSNHIHVELLRKKYQAYRFAIFSMKILVIGTAIGTIYLGLRLIYE